MDPRKRDARTAGLWYLAMALTGPIGLIYVPSRILVAGDPGATAAAIAANGWLLRAGIASSLVCQVAFVFLVLALDRLLRGVSEKHAKLMVSLVIAAVPIAVALELFSVAALKLGSGATGGLSAEQRAAMALWMLEVRQQGIAVAGVFWGLWLLPFGVLVIRSGFIPRILGVLLIAGCFSYLVDSAVALLAPDHREAVSGILMLPLAGGEISMVAWLLVWGARTAPAASVQPS